jgi:dsRNA-specific ribonuclease
MPSARCPPHGLGKLQAAPLLLQRSLIDISVALNKSDPQIVELYGRLVFIGDQEAVRETLREMIESDW